MGASYESFHGVIEEVSSEEESLFGLNPEWQYKVHFQLSTDTCAEEGHKWFWESDLNHSPTY